MKYISILFISILLFAPANAQELRRLDELGNPIKEKTRNLEFIPEEIIVKFKDNYLNTDVLESNISKFTCSQAQKSNGTIRKSISFFSHFSSNKMRKVVTKLKVIGKLAHLLFIT